MTKVSRQNLSFPETVPVEKGLGSRRHIYVAVAVVCLCLIAGTAFRIVDSRQRTLDAEMVRLGLAAETAEQRVAESYRTVRQVLESMASVPAGRERHETFRLADLILPFGDIRRAFVVDAKGRVVEASGPGIVGQDMAAQPYFAELRAQADSRAMYVSPAPLAVGGEEQIVFASIGLADSDGRWAGAAVVVLDISFFNTIAERMTPSGVGDSSALVTMSGKIIARYPQARNFFGMDVSKGQAYRAHLDSGLAQTEHRVVAATDRQDKLIIARTFRAVGGSSVLIFVTRAVDPVLLQWRTSAWFDAGFTMLALVALAVLAWLAARREDRLAEAQAVLAQKEELFHSLFQSCKAVELIIDPVDGMIIEANDAAEMFYGWSVDQLRTMRISDINTLTRDEVAAEMERAREESRSHFFFRHRRASGDIRDVEVHSGPILHAGRQLLYSIIHDVSDRVQSERERERLAMAIEQSPVSVVITDPEGLIEYVNPTFTRITGYEAHEVVGNTPRLLKTGHTSDDEYKSMWQALKAGQEWSAVFLNKRKDGSTYWEQARISPVKNRDGTITGFIAVKENISGRIEAEETIRALNIRLQAIMDAASEVSVIATDPTGVITTFNRGAERMLGYSVDELVGRQTPAVFHKVCEVEARGAELTAQLDSPVQGFRAFVEMAERQGSDSREWTYVRKDGGEVPVSLVVTPVRADDGTMMGYLGIAVDISGRKQVERQLLDSNAQLDAKARELARVNEELAQFAYAASHDLRQPLRMVSSYLTLIERKLGPELDDDAKSYLGFAVQGAKRMDALILGLLDYSRVGRAEQPFQPVALADVVANQVLVLGFVIEETGAQVDVSPDLPVVAGDEQELGRLVGNLLGNALKYRSNDRPLRVEIGWKADQSEIILWVKDNGRGIDPKDHERAFGVFQRLVRRDEVEGTGIGLAVCRKIAHHHGGRMWLESADGQGCTFFVALPVFQDGRRDKE